MSVPSWCKRNWEGPIRFAELPLGKEGGHLLSFEALAGGRYNDVKSAVEILNFLKSKESQDWIDPIVGGVSRQA
jgi:hypothetical protein